MKFYLLKYFTKKNKIKKNTWSIWFTLKYWKLIILWYCRYILWYNFLRQIRYSSFDLFIICTKSRVFKVIKFKLLMEFYKRKSDRNFLEGWENTVSVFSTVFSFRLVAVPFSPKYCIPSRFGCHFLPFDLVRFTSCCTNSLFSIYWPVRCALLTVCKSVHIYSRY